MSIIPQFLKKEYKLTKQQCLGFSQALILHSARWGANEFADERKASVPTTADAQQMGP